MKLSDKTITILKNFATINQSMWFRKGTRQTTVEVDDHVAAIAELEDLPQDFGIYDLNQFLANISTLNSPELTFKEKSVHLSDGNISMDYPYADAAVLKKLREAEVEDLTVDAPDVEFELNQDSYQKIVKLANMNDVPIISITGKNGKLSCVAESLELKSAPTASYVIGEYTGKDFRASFNLKFLNILPNNYSVKLQNPDFGIFTSKDVSYLIAQEIQPKKGAK